MHNVRIVLMQSSSSDFSAGLADLFGGGTTTLGRVSFFSGGASTCIGFFLWLCCGWGCARSGSGVALFNGFHLIQAALVASFVAVLGAEK
jgi:hypothetical protein